MSSAFVGNCKVSLDVKDGKLTASVTSDKESRSGDRYDYSREVHLLAKIQENNFGGTGMLFTGTVGSNAVKVKGWESSW